MKDVNNLLDNLKGVQRQVAAYIVLEVASGRFKEAVIEVRDIMNKFLIDRTTVSVVMAKLQISEIVNIKKLENGKYMFKQYNIESFKKVVQVFKEEVMADD